MRKLYIFTLIILFISANSFAQDRFANITIKTHKLTDNIYMLQGSGGNIGVSAGQDGILIIDDQYAPLAEKISAALKDINKGELEFVLTTHYHGDHTGGNEFFGKSGAKIISHTNNRKRLVDGGMKKDGLPVITFDDELSVHFNGEEIRAQHFPNSHTDGDLVIYFVSSNVLHMGDTFFNYMFPYIDTGAGGNAISMLKNVRSLLSKIPDDVIIIPGHGPIAKKVDLEIYAGMIEETLMTVESKMLEGKSKAEIVKDGLGKKWSSWTWSFITEERWINALHKSIIDKK